MKIKFGFDFESPISPAEAQFISDLFELLRDHGYNELVPTKPDVEIPGVERAAGEKE